MMPKQQRTRTRTMLAVALLTAVAVLQPAPAFGGVLRVDGSVSAPGGPGTTWAEAFHNLQDALAAAAFGDEIWVAAETYTPAAPGGDRSATFQLRNDVKIYGGFAGGETDLSQRDPVTNETILSGDLNDDDVPVADPADLLAELTRAENSYHVVTGTTAKPSRAVLDGFTITAGNANGVAPDNNGGGVFNATGDPELTRCVVTGNVASARGGGLYNFQGASPHIAGCTITGNAATWGGGALNWRSNPVLDECTFSANIATNAGGGVYNLEGNPVGGVETLTRCIFTRNQSGSGGGMFISFSNSIITGCVFIENSAGQGGGIHNSTNASPTLTNCIFRANSTDAIGAGMNIFGGGPTLTNCTFSGNTAVRSRGGGIAISPIASLTVTNCVLWGNSDSRGPGASGQIFTEGETTIVNHTLIQGGWSGAGGIGIIDADPLFVDDDLRLLCCSPAIDAGDNAAVVGVPTDLDRNSRRVDSPFVADTGNGTAPIVDMGAYENRDVTDSDADAICNGCDNCPAILNPLQEDFDEDGLGDACDPDDDGDGVPDGSDVCPGFDDNIDDDLDGVPNGCDVCPGLDNNTVDFNLNGDLDGVPDECDNCPAIPNPLQEDFNQNGLGDACDPDDDDDGILDEVDVHPLAVSKQFSDLPLGGVTSGEVVVGPFGNSAIPDGVRISDAASPDGIRVEVAGADVLDFIFFCANGVNVTSVGPSETVYTCGSLGIDAISGSVTATFIIDGDMHTVVIVEGGSVTLDDSVDEFGQLQGMTVIADGANGTVTIDDEPLTPGQTAGVGDCGTLLVHANKHTIGSGSHPSSTKEPLVGLEVCTYDKSEGSCAAALGVSWRNYPDILASCDAVACGTTDANGEATIILPPGDYIVIAQWDDDNNATTPDFILGVSASDLVCGEFMQKHLQVLVDANGNKRPGKTTRLTGSELLIIEPEYVIWDQTEQLYPFVFETIGDWGVTTSVTPPEGFIADFNELSEAVNNDLQAVQFTITEVGSDLVPTETTFEVTHKGRSEIVRSSVGIFLTPAYARSRGFDVAKLRAKGLLLDKPGRGKNSKAGKP